MSKAHKTQLICLNCRKEYTCPNDRGRRLYCPGCAKKLRAQANKQAVRNFLKKQKLKKQKLLEAQL